jgi:uncharacterized protein with ParB-like and HNH nuclease domain
LYHYAKANGPPDLADMLYETYLINKFGPSETGKLKLKPTENNKEALRCVLENRTGDYPEYSRIIDNYNYINGYITAERFDLIRKGMDKLIFVEISLERGKDNPQRIFESLNSTGLDLSQADLIRNYILMGLTREEQEKIYTDHWAVIEKNAKDDNLNESRVSDFVRDYLTSLKNVIPKKESVYLTFQKQYPEVGIDKLKDFLPHMTDFSKYYGKLLNPLREADPVIAKHIGYIRQLKVEVAYPFLMPVYADYSNGIIDKKTFIAVLELVQSYVWRRFIVGLPSHALNKVFMGLYNKIENHTNYLYFVQKALLERRGNQRFPEDKEIEEELKIRDVYNVSPKSRTDYFLERLENYNNREPVLLNDDITVEHIFPRNPDSDWKDELSDQEYNDIHANYLHTIGNLTLSGNNGALSNKAFIKKRDMNVDDGRQGYRYSRMVWLNEDLKEAERWNKIAIEMRTARLTKRFLLVWERPNINVDDTTENAEINIFEAEDPTGRELENVLFFDQKFSVTTAAGLYELVVKELFERHPEFFVNAPQKIKLEQNPPPEGSYGKYKKLNDTYSFKIHGSSRDLFGMIKKLLKEFDYEDELIIKFA